MIYIFFKELLNYIESYSALPAPIEKKIFTLAEKASNKNVKVRETKAYQQTTSLGIIVSLSP